MAILGLVVLSWSLAADPPPPPAGEQIVPEGARLEHLFTQPGPYGSGMTEGPAVAPDGAIVFSDIPTGDQKGRILRFDPRSKKVTVAVPESRKSNGLFFDGEGRLVVCEGANFGGRRVSRIDLKTGKSDPLAIRFGERRLNSPNDLCLDLAGRIYFTDPRYVGPEPRELDFQGVYRIDPDGSLHLVTKAVSKPNGIVLSPDQKTLYVAETNNDNWAMKILAFDLAGDGGVSGPPRTLVDFGKQAGCDGMTVDVEGNIYLTVRSVERPGVQVIDSTGKELAFIPTGPAQAGAERPVGLPSNCVFGRGVESRTLYITVDRGLYRIPLAIDGFHLPTKVEASLLERFRREFVAIRPGENEFPKEFTLGRKDGPPSERPARQVKLDRAFEVAAYEVPQNLWTAVMGQNPSRWKGPRNSVELLSFDDALDFCRNATHRMRTLGLIAPKEFIRLPSEAEWEYVARAGSKTVYSFGDSPEKLGDYAWFHGNAAGNDPPVGAKKPNPWGLYDIHGYLWEWCADHWHPDHEGAPSDGSTRKKSGAPDTSEHRVLRSGSWKDPAERLTSTARRGAPRAFRDDAVGLRCVLSGEK